jgi:drug/metabolite transporter (DMT)-like permease
LAPEGQPETINVSQVVQAKRRDTRLALNALFSGALAIAFAPIFVRLSQVGPTATAFWRLSLSLPVLWLLMKRDPHSEVMASKLSKNGGYRRLVIAGIFFAGDLGFWHWSIRYTSVANATLLANFASIFVALVSWLYYHQRIKRNFVIGLALALAGTLFLVEASFNFGGTHLLGDALGLVTAMFYGAYILAVKQLRDDYSTVTVMTWVVMVSASIILPVAWLLGESLLPTSLNGWLVVFGLAWISQVGGQGLITYALAKLPASFSSVGLLVQPVGAALLAWILLGEGIGVMQIAGGALVLGGVYLARRASQFSTTRIITF